MPIKISIRLTRRTRESRSELIKKKKKNDHGTPAIDRSITTTRLTPRLKLTSGGGAANSRDRDSFGGLFEAATVAVKNRYLTKGPGHLHFHRAARCSSRLVRSAPCTDSYLAHAPPHISRILFLSLKGTYIYIYSSRFFLLASIRSTANRKSEIMPETK